MMTQVLIRASDELIASIDRAAQIDGRSRSEFLRHYAGVAADEIAKHGPFTPFGPTKHTRKKRTKKED